MRFTVFRTWKSKTPLGEQSGGKGTSWRGKGESREESLSSRMARPSVEEGES